MNIDLNKTNNFYFKVHTPLAVAVKTIKPFSVYNSDNIPSGNGFIIASNHQSMFDAWLIYAALGKKPLHAIFKSELRDTKLSGFYEKMGSIFLVRDNLDSRISVLEEATSTVLRNNNLLIFPEGTRNKNDKVPLLDFQAGAASIAKLTGKEILPVAITYNSEIDGKTRLRIGKTIHPDNYDRVNDITAKTINSIMQMLLCFFGVKGFRKINRVNAYNPKKLTKLKKQLKRAMLRSNPTYVATNTVKR